MKSILLRYGWLLAAIGLSLLCDASAWSEAAATPLETTKRSGDAAIVYNGPQISLALSYRFAKNNPEGTWLLLDTVMTAAGAPVEIPRSAISVRTPEGRTVPLATQQEFGKAYPGLASSITRAGEMREPMGYLLRLRPRRLDFFSEPGRHLAFDSAWLDDRHNSYGSLYFELPGGIRRGDYALLITLPESQVTIPFTI